MYAGVCNVGREIYVGFAIERGMKLHARHRANASGHIRVCPLYELKIYAVPIVCHARHLDCIDNAFLILIRYAMGNCV